MWRNNQVTFLINSNMSAYGGALAPKVTSAQFLAAAQQAIATWQGICKTSLQVIDGGTTTLVRNDADTNNVISYDNRLVGGGSQFGSTLTLATAFTIIDSISQVYSGCDITVNGGAVGSFSVTGAPLSYDLISTLTHQIGHCLGLDHPVNPPGVTSTNAILNTSAMYPTQNAGEIFERTLKQDEKDAMICLYPGWETNPWDACASYHGTNGGAALTGVVNGGAQVSYPEICGRGSEAMNAGVSTQVGGGCVTSAIAAGPRGRASSRGGVGSYFLELGVALLGFVAFRLVSRRRKTKAVVGFAFLAIGLSSAPAYAGSFLDLGVDYRSMTATGLNTFASIPGDSSVWQSKSDPETFTRSIDPMASIGFGEGPWVFGVYGRYLIPRQVQQRAVAGSNGNEVIKSTSLTGWLAGPVVRYYFVDKYSDFGIFAEAAVALGRMSLKQTIVDVSESTLGASAMAAEVMATVGVRIPMFNTMGLQIMGYYSRQGTNAMVVNSVTGSLYGGVANGNRLQVSDGGSSTDLKADRSGFGVLLTVTFNLVPPLNGIRLDF